jgi:hypothetical protein
VDQFVDKAVKDIKHLQRAVATTTAAGVRYTALKNDVLDDSTKPLPHGMPKTLALPDLKLSVTDRLPPDFCDIYNSEIAM